MGIPRAWGDDGEAMEEGGATTLRNSNLPTHRVGIPTFGSAWKFSMLGATTPVFGTHRLRRAPTWSSRA
jgi:hypothetical protein